MTFAGIKDHVREVHRVQESMIPSALSCPDVSKLAAIICPNCKDSENSRFWFSETDAFHHVEVTHGKFFKKNSKGVVNICMRVSSCNFLHKSS